MLAAIRRFLKNRDIEKRFPAVSYHLCKCSLCEGYRKIDTLAPERVFTRKS